jgi:hypothetical protein
MPILTTTHELAAPAEAVWRLLEDFGAIDRWWPADGPAPIEQVIVEGSGVGMIRHIRNRGMTHSVSERLDFIEASSRNWMLSIVGVRPLGLTAYVAEGHLTELARNRCRIDYCAHFSVPTDREEGVRKALLKSWTLMFQGLERAANAARTAKL